MQKDLNIQEPTNIISQSGTISFVNRSLLSSSSMIVPTKFFYFQHNSDDSTIVTPQINPFGNYSNTLVVFPFFVPSTHLLDTVYTFSIKFHDQGMTIFHLKSSEYDSLSCALSIANEMIEGDSNSCPRLSKNLHHIKVLPELSSA